MPIDLGLVTPSAPGPHAGGLRRTAGDAGRPARGDSRVESFADVVARTTRRSDGQDLRGRDVPRPRATGEGAARREPASDVQQAGGASENAAHLGRPVPIASTRAPRDDPRPGASGGRADEVVEQGDATSSHAVQDDQASDVAIAAAAVTTAVMTGVAGTVTRQKDPVAQAGDGDAPHDEVSRVQVGEHHEGPDEPGATMRCDASPQTGAAGERSPALPPGPHAHSGVAEAMPHGWRRSGASGQVGSQASPGSVDATDAAGATAAVAAATASAAAPVPAEDDDTGPRVPGEGAASRGVTDAARAVAVGLVSAPIHPPCPAPVPATRDDSAASPSGEPTSEPQESHAVAAGGTDIPRSTAAAARLAAQLQALLEPDNTWAAPGKPVTTDPVVLPADAAGRESSGVVQGGVARVEAGADAPGATSYRPRAGGFAASEHHAFTPVGGASALAAQVFEVPKSTQGERRPGEVSSPPPPSAVDRGLSGEGWLAGPPQSIAAVRAQIDGAMASTTAPLASIADEHGVVPQVVKAIHLQWRQGLGEARLRLDPPHLGEIHVSLRVQEGVVSAFVRAENPTVQTWIDMRQQDLRNALEEQGLRLERFEVVVDPDGGRRDSNDQQSPAPRPRTPRGRPGAPRFEVNA